jgi:hypothetical protein
MTLAPNQFNEPANQHYLAFSTLTAPSRYQLQAVAITDSILL